MKVTHIIRESLFMDAVALLALCPFVAEHLLPPENDK